MKWAHNSRITLFLGIVSLGLVLRFLNYATMPPFGETRDEFMYPWAGLTLIQTGVPSSWSYFESYTNTHSISLWDQEFRIVTPWFDKPLLYPLITGSFVYILGAREFGDVSLTTLRLVPVLLSGITMVLVFLFANKLFSTRIAFLSLILYATIPSIVLGNRLSLTENLLTPLALLTLYLTHTLSLTSVKNVVVLGILCGLAFHTKQIGAIVMVYPLSFLITQKRIKSAIIFMSTFLTFVCIHFGIVGWYDLGLYLRVMSDFRVAHALVGLPELIQTIFRFPTLSQKTRLFLDGSTVVGLMTLFMSPVSRFIDGKKLAALTFFPFSYIGLLTLIESGATNFSYFGWHIYPLFPFIAIALALYFNYVYEKRSLLLLAIPLLILGSSTIRFVFLPLPVSLHYLWQYVFVACSSVVALVWLLKTKRQFVLICLFALLIVSNIWAVVASPQFYPTTPAHLDEWGPLTR